MRSAPRRLSRAERQIVEDYRALVPVARRRSHLLLLSRKDNEAPMVQAIVRPEDAPALRPLVARLRENGRAGDLRVVEGEDGIVDVLAAWCRGVSLDRYLVADVCGHA